MNTPSKFIGGVLDGQEYEFDEEFESLNVPSKEGVLHHYPDDVVREWQVYVRKGDVYEYVETKTHI